MEYLIKMFSLEGKKAVITGGGGILGSEIARVLGMAGANVSICDIKNYNEVAEKLKKEGIEAEGYFMNVMERDIIKETADKILKNGEVHILVNAAGGNVKEATTSDTLSFFDLPLEGIEKVVALNLYGGAILPSQIFGREMVKNSEGGSIINISSMNAFRPLTKIPGYSAAKAAVSNFTQWLAVHLAQGYNKKLRVNAIAPGFFLTQQNRYLLLDDKDELTERGKTIIIHTPMGRFGEPSDLAGIVVYLASDASRFVTGTVIPVDGGFNAFAGV
ncbi:MAG: SDR family oxidoreductase [Candidatus Omnitrophica bacterium]|nr:SDR family oxidoreductase [Candidatus Omnitrophota bacterium]MCM8776693.1 SDR family oxidoreductase [Candidatus Omnitrophota bacterium]